MTDLERLDGVIGYLAAHNMGNMAQAVERAIAEIRRLKDELASARECLRMTASEAERRLMDENAGLRQKLADARLERDRFFEIVSRYVLALDGLRDYRDDAGRYPELYRYAKQAVDARLADLRTAVDRKEGNMSKRLETVHSRAAADELERLGRAAYKEFTNSGNWDAMSAMGRSRWGRIAAGVLREQAKQEGR